MTETDTKFDESISESILLEKQIAFMEKYVTNPKGSKFSIKGREDFVYSYLSALNGWKIGKNVDFLGESYLDAPICEECAEKLGEITLDFDYKKDCNEVVETPNGPEKCSGLIAKNIWVIYLHADRRVGKTFTTGAHIIERIARDRHYRGRYIATGEAHTRNLSDENIEGVVNRNPVLAEQFKILKGKSISFSVRNNLFTLTSTSGSAQLGGGLQEIFVDEAKQVPFDIVNKLLPSIQEMHGWRCIKCGWKYSGAMDRPERCPECGDSNDNKEVYERTLLPWNATAVFMSNAGTIVGDAMYDWFDSQVEDLLRHPAPNVVVLKYSSNAINPDVNSEVKNIALDLIRRTPGLEGMTNEWDNEAKTIGRPFVDSWNHIFVPFINVQEPICYEPCIAFLDMARTTDLVSLTMYKDVTERGDLTWDELAPLYLEYWDPQDPDCDISILSELEDKKVVNEDLLFEKIDGILSRFPNIRLFWVDTRGVTQSGKASVSSIAKKLVRKLRYTGKAYSATVTEFEGHETERNAAYNLLEAKITNAKIEAFNTSRLDNEFKKAVWVPSSGGKTMQVRERGKSNNMAQRRKNHLDLLEGLATICLMANELQTVGGMAHNIKRIRKDAMGGGTLGKSVPAKKLKTSSSVEKKLDFDDEDFTMSPKRIRKRNKQKLMTFSDF